MPSPVAAERVRELMPAWSAPVAIGLSEIPVQFLYPSCGVNQPPTQGFPELIKKPEEDSSEQTMVVAEESEHDNIHFANAAKELLRNTVCGHLIGNNDDREMTKVVVWLLCKRVTLTKLSKIPNLLINP